MAEKRMAMIAQGFLTMSKHPSQFMGADSYMVKAAGCRINGKIDYFGACGANLINIQNCFSLPNKNAQILAKRLKDIIPVCESIKILKTGSDACNAAMRIARTYTGKKFTIGTGYHGWGNAFIASEEPGFGTITEFYQKLSDLSSVIEWLKRDTSQLAAVIIEPVQLDFNVRNELKEIRRLCSEKKIILIFDEIITGFRVPGYTISNLFNIYPDLICLGKALGNGYPISVVGGHEEIMQQPYFISGTFFEEDSSLKEALKTLDFLSEARLNRLWNLGEWFQDEFNKLNQEVQVVGYPTRGEWRGRLVYHFWQEMRHKYLLGKAWFITFSHTKTILKKTLKDSKDAMIGLEKKELTFPEPKPFFKRN